LKVLLAVVSCHRRTEFSDAVRKTWLPRVPKEVDVKFFLGTGVSRDLREDEVLLDCDDSYKGLPNKVQEIVRWAYTNGYDYVLKCDDDVVMNPESVLSSDFTAYDFTGPQNPWVKAGEIRTPWGFCYWLSRKAMKLVVEAPLPGQQGSVHSYKHNNDEAWISTVLYVNGIHLHDEQRYFLHRGKPLNLRPLNRPLRAPKRPVPVEDIAPQGTFAWCIYIDSGQHNVPPGIMLEEFHKVYEAQKCQ
jgi:galactosyltransferase